jgi:HlyD family type I secretion membrane fusion protein
MRALPIAQPRSLEPVSGRAREFESATAEVIARLYPVAERGVLYAMCAFIICFIAFISVFKIERVVNAPGRLLPIAGTLTVQPMEKAIIRNVLVSVGAVVKKGQVLATCDPTFATADLTQLQEKIASLRAQQTRMEAEAAGREPALKTDNAYDILQESIFLKRRTEFRAGVADFDQRINSTEAQVAGLEQKIKDDEARLGIAKQMEGMNSDLAKNGYVSKMDLLNAQTQRMTVSSDLAQSRTDLVSNQHVLQSLKEQRQSFIDKWNDDNLSALAGVKDNLDAAEQDLAKATRLSELVNLVAPEDAVVVKVPNLSVGAIAVDAQPLFSLVPLNAPLEVDAQIDSQDIGFVKVGDPVTIKFDAYKFLEHGTGKGVVKTISQDAFTEASTQDSLTAPNATAGTQRAPYFDARITLTDVKLHDVARNFRMSPGMTLEADIVVGKRTILWYLIGGAMRSGAEAMHEP